MRISVGLVSAVLGVAGALSVFACSPEVDEAAQGGQSDVKRENDLYDADGTLSVRIEAPLSTLFQRLKDGKADPAPVVEDGGAPEKYKAGGFSEVAKIVYTLDGKETALDARLYVRGESSRTDCPFPKLKIDFSDKEQLKKTPFKGHGEVRINTHCGPGEAVSRSKLGRVTNGVGPVRESLTYRIIRAMGVETYKTRVLKVHYKDTANNEEIDTFAMAMESSDDAAQRFTEAKPPLAEEGAQLLDWGNARTTPENEAHVAIAEAFAGNKDWGGSHNVDYYGKQGGATAFRVPQDFDLGAVVLGDNAHYWKGIANVADATASFKVGDVGFKIKGRQKDVEDAFAAAELAAVEAGAVASEDKKTTTDPGFLEAKNRIAQIFALPEVKDAVAAEAPAADADAGAADAGDAADK